MDNGRLRVTDDNMPNFLSLYHHSLLQGNKMSVSEQRSAVFRMHWEFDFKWKECFSIQCCESCHNLLRLSKLPPPSVDSKDHGKAMTADPSMLPSTIVLPKPSAAESTSVYFKGHHASVSDALLAFVRVLQEDTRSLYEVEPDVNIRQRRHLVCVLKRQACVDKEQYLYDAVGSSSSSAGDKIITCACDAPRKSHTLSWYRHWSFGLHVIMPNLHVNTDTARQLYENNLYELHEKEPGRDWGLILDRQIYFRNGLRMPYCHKCVICPSCKNDNDIRLLCSSCEKTGHLYLESRIYRPCACLWSDGSPASDLLSLFRDNVAQCLRYCIIRCPASTMPTKGFRMQPGLAQWSYDETVPSNQTLWEEEDNNSLSQTRTLTHKPPLTLPQFKDDLAQAKQRGRKVEYTYYDRDSLVFTTIQELTRTAFENLTDMYKRILLTEVYSNQKKTYYVAKTAGRGANYCQNIESDHRRSKIYFYITIGGIRQKCYCRCEKTCSQQGTIPTVPCKEYESQPIPLLHRQIMILFPDAKVIPPIVHTSKKTKTFSTTKTNSEELLNIQDIILGGKRRDSMHLQSIALDIDRQLEELKSTSRKNTMAMPKTASGGLKRSFPF
jgi:hypothetical protein